jgi:hypothetical protein
MSTPDQQRSRPGPAPPSGPRSATGYGVLALCLAAAAFVVSPFMLLIPLFGFLPAILAAAGVAVAWAGLRRGNHGVGLAITGLVLSVVLFGLTASIATLWNFLVVEPAVRDYQELQDVIDSIRDKFLGS